VTGNKVTVEGVDLSGPQDDASIAALRRHWSEHGVIVFRDQHNLSESDLVRFSRYFGDLEIHVRREYLSKDNPEILYVSNKTEAGKSIGILSDHEVGWHHDQIYLERPALGSLLYAVEIPPSGGNTEFINLANAFDSLPEDTQRQIEPLRAVQSYAYFNGQWSEPLRRSRHDGLCQGFFRKRKSPATRCTIRTRDTRRISLFPRMAARRRYHVGQCVDHAPQR